MRSRSRNPVERFLLDEKKYLKRDFYIRKPRYQEEESWPRRIKPRTQTQIGLVKQLGQKICPEAEVWQSMWTCELTILYVRTT